MVIRHWHFRAHYDGKVIIPDERVELPPGTWVTVTVDAVQASATSPVTPSPALVPADRTEECAAWKADDIRIYRRGERFVLTLPPDKARISVAELVDLGWLAPLVDMVTLLNGKPVAPEDVAEQGQVLEQWPVQGRLGAEPKSAPAEIQDRQRRLARAIGVLDAPPPPPEALRRDALYGAGS